MNEVSDDICQACRNSMHRKDIIGLLFEQVPFYIHSRLV